VRTDWKSKNFNPNMDPTVLDSSTDESEIEQREKQERDDDVNDLDDYSSPLKLKTQMSRGDGSTSPQPKTLIDLSGSDNQSSKPSANMQL